MNERKYRSRLRKAKRRSEYRRRRMEIWEEEHRYRIKPRHETSKALALYLFALLNIIVLYSMVAMWHFSDLSYLGVLISDIAAQIMLYGIYCLKAYKAKRSKERLAFERELHLNGASNDTIEDIIDAGVDESTTEHCID